MSQIDPEEILRRIRAAIDNGRKTKTRRPFLPPEPKDFAPDLQILCFDQTLSNCGWALLNTEEEIWVRESGTIRTPVLGSSVRGFSATLAKSVPLARGVANLLNETYGQFDKVVLEMPAVAGFRTESSLIAAVTICVELDRLGLAQPELISRQAAGALLCGDRLASKKTSSEVVNRLVVEHPKGAGQWTEHVRDAVFVGLKDLYVGETP
jgi:hypothetical protein